MTTNAAVKKLKMSTVGYNFSTPQIKKIAKDLAAAGYDVELKGELMKAKMDGAEVACALKLRATWILRGVNGLFTPVG